jgi:hypothetical protein
MTSKTKECQITIKVTRQTRDELLKKSDDLGGVGISNVVRMAITEYLKRG